MDNMINPHTGRPFVKNFFKDYAKGKPCLIRVAREAGYTCESTLTTVLCHLTMPGLKAMGKKLVPDLLAAHGCMVCHDLVDGRIHPNEYATTYCSRPYIQQAHFEGMARTIELLVREGYLPNP